MLYYHIFTLNSGFRAEKDLNLENLGKPDYCRSIIINSFGFVVLIALLLMSTNILNAANTKWTGSVNHNWFNAGNWDNGVPGLLDTAHVLSDSAVIAATTDIKHLIFSNAAIVVAPNGKLRILDSDGIGMNCSNARMYNHGLIRISSPSAIGIYLNGTSNFKNLNGSKTFVNHGAQESIVIEENAIIENSFTGLIQSDTCTGSLYNLGELRNAGTINLNYSLIGFTTNIASLENNGALVNNGLIEIDSSGLGGLTNSDSLVNNGTIQVHNCSTSGIFSDGNIDNNGSLTIEDCDTGMTVDFFSSVFNHGVTMISNIENTALSIKTLALFENYDTLSISNADEFGINSAGRLNNMHYIKIDGWGQFSNANAGIFNTDTLYNAPSAQILLNGQSTGNYGIENHVTVDTCIIINHGEIDIQQIDVIGLFNIGRVMNYNEINIHNTSIGGAGILNLGFLENQDSIILIDILNSGITSSHIMDFKPGSIVEISGTSGVGITNQGDAHFTNSGSLKILDTGSRGIINRGFMTNSHTISITTTASHGIESFDSLINETTGIIDIKDTNNNSGIENSNFSNPHAYFLNLGKLELFDIRFYGINNEAIFTNDGSVRIDSTQDTGILNTGVINNTDSIIIKSTKSHGITNSDTLKNNAGGVISISLLTLDSSGIYNDTDHYLSNEGDIYIHDLSGVGLKNAGELINSNTLEIENTMIYGIWNQAGVMTNSTGANINVNSVTNDEEGALYFNDNNASFSNDGNVSLNNLEIEDGTSGTGIKCMGGTTFHITSNGHVEMMGIMNMSDLIVVEENAIFQVDGTFDIQN